MFQDSLLSINKVRAEIDAAKARSERRTSPQPYDIETCVRTRSNAWVVARIRGSNELYLVLERGSETLLLTAESTEKFSRRYAFLCLQNSLINNDAMRHFLIEKQVSESGRNQVYEFWN